ncbi:PQQ-binding-like beta-propeller repeat protein [Rhodopirellula halodulae]|uniref:PQQ-binding-like beta-propeller repeat protein n=1 Tax=Rhodopirellula halodulae TaxID=2894198 RepID=UPI001E585246|nr:PQQ-binding-like beta-propeller repeat protein [Rhodopirellula sp. JC737]MCC9657112.1 PQQ-binding-like beta-propeller repeat protein [Rhodopirellula sp. JC737]
MRDFVFSPMLSTFTLRRAAAALITSGSLALSGNCLPADDWSGWQGDQRDGVYRESGVVNEIPESGLPLKWKAKIAGGYAGPSVADGRVFVFDYAKRQGEAFNDPGKRADLTGDERLIVLDAETGKELWRHEYERPYSISYPAGPRCTPTVDGDHVYILGSEGDLRCLSVTDGELVWSRNLPTDFDAEVPIWGFSAHPLVHGDLLYTMVGGDGQGIVAFDKSTGEVRWKQLDCNAGYCAPSILRRAESEQLLVYSPTGVHGLDPITGDPIWNMDISPMYDMSIAIPVVEGNRIFASGIRTESVMFELDPQSNATKEIWRGERDHSVYSSNSPAVAVDGVIYGTDCNVGELIAVDFETGDRIWSTFQATQPNEKRFIKHGTAFLNRLGDSDRFLVFSENGDLIIATLSKDGFQEHGRFRAIEPTGEAFGRSVAWTAPAYANQTAFIRNDQEIVAYDLSAK